MVSFLIFLSFFSSFLLSFGVARAFKNAAGGEDVGLTKAPASPFQSLVVCPSASEIATKDVPGFVMWL